MSIVEPTDEELRDLFGLGGRRPTKLGLPLPDPICLSAQCVDSLVTGHLGNPSCPDRRRVLAQEIQKVAESFAYDVVIQSRPMPSASLKQLKRIELAAHRLRDVLRWDGESTETIPHEPRWSWLRQAAEAYGARVKLPAGVSPFEIEWNYWSAHKLPAAIVGIRLLELWAHDAQEIIRRNTGTRQVGPRSKHVLRVCVHRLALFWMRALGSAPGAGIRIDSGQAIMEKDRYIPDGPFMRFALEFFKCLKDCANPQSPSTYPRQLLSPSRNTIRKYLQQFKARLKGKAGIQKSRRRT